MRPQSKHGKAQFERSKTQLNYEMTNSRNLSEMTSKKLRNKTEIQHTNELTRNDSRIELKIENKTRIYLFW